MNGRKRAMAAVLAGLAVLLLAGAGAVLVRRRAESRRIAARVAARQAVCARFGVASDGRSPFVALPPSLPHHAGWARLGQELSTDRRLACSKWRTCIACHRPDADCGGTDSKIHAGLLTRPLYNAVLGSVFFGDGSTTNFADAVRRMIEDVRYGNAGPLSNVVARLAQDEKTVTRFQFCFEDGLTGANLLAAFEAYARTLLISDTPFDAWCAGRPDAFGPRRIRGADVFVARGCTDCHDGPALGALRAAGGKKVSALRGLSRRTVYLADGSLSDLGAVLTRMPGGDVEEEDRTALLDFLRSL